MGRERKREGGEGGEGGYLYPSPGNRARLQFCKLQACIDQVDDGGNGSVYFDDSISGTVFTCCPSFPAATGCCPLAPASPRPPL